MISLGLLIILIQINLIENVSERSAGLDCTKRNSDGLYGRGCSSKFMRCYNGSLYVYRCHENLKFNVETAKCEKATQVIACINNMNNDRTILKAIDPIDCSKREDGVYGSGKCSTTYYHCSKGSSKEMLCPAGLYYNDKLKGCDEIDRIDECNVLTALQGVNERRNSYLGKHSKSNLMLIGNRQIINKNKIYNDDIKRLSISEEKNDEKNDSNDMKQSARETLRANEAVNFRYKKSLWKFKGEWNCTGMKDGNYAMFEGKCSKYFWHCSNGETTKRICGDEQFFNIITGKCDTASNIKDCIQKKSLATKTAMKSNCTTLNESVVKHCSQFYYNCTDGEFLLFRCPEGYVYNAEQKRCDPIESVQECKNTGNSSLSVTSSSIQISRVMPIPELNGFCNSIGDEMFSAGCENHFYFCASGHAYHIKCPEGLFFDSETLSCNYKEHVPFCNLTLLNSEVITNERDYEYSFGQQVDQDDGSKEIFDKQTKNVIQNNTDHMLEADLPDLIGVPISETKVPVLPEDLDCQSKANGLYSIGCKTQFVLCANQRMYFFECPQHLIFNEKAQACDYAENNENCSNIVSTDKLDWNETTPVDMQQKNPSEEKKEERVDGAVIHDQAFCEKLNDGVYFNDCGKEYTVCSRHVTHAYTCPEGQIMDPTRNTCNEPKNIPECVEQ